jgi:hypothetical protein
VLRIYGLKTDDVIGWKKQHKGASKFVLFAKHNLNDHVKENTRNARGTKVGEEVCIQDFVGKPEGKRPLERGWEGIKMDLKQIQWDGLELTCLRTDSHEHSNETSSSIKFQEVLK